MGATMKDSTLQALEIDAAIIESLSEPVLSELIGFIEYDNQLAGRNLGDRDLSARDRDPNYYIARETPCSRVAATIPDR